MKNADAGELTKPAWVSAQVARADSPSCKQLAMPIALIKTPAQPNCLKVLHAVKSCRMPDWSHS
jgi:hypothetical protein